MLKLRTAILSGAVLLASCGQTQTDEFDPEDPVAIAEIEALLETTMEGAREADADRVLAMAEGEAQFTFITGDLMLAVYDFAANTMDVAVAKELLANSDIQEFYLGIGEGGSKKSFRNVKHYRRRKRWLG